MPIDVIGAAQPAQRPPAGTHGGDDATGSSVARVTAWLEARAMFVIAVSAVLMISMIGIPRHLSQDGWLALIAGRTIAWHGIPQADFFTHMSHGVRWVDQQWLAQWLMYEVEHVGGLPLLCVLYVLVTAAAFAGAVAAARRLGSEDLHVLIATLPGAFFYLVTAVSIRTQGLAYPLFVTTLWLLAADLRNPAGGRRVYWVIPILLLWANLHGSATLGAGLAGLYGLLLALRSVRRDGIRGLGNLRALTFVVLPPLTLLATPYGTGMVHYYRVTLLNPRFSQMVTEWKPVTSVPVLAVPLLLVIAATAAVTVTLLVRGRQRAASRPRAFDVLVLMVLAVGAIMAVRNVTWFGLALVVLLPPLLTQLRGGRPAPLRRARLNMVLAAGFVSLAAIVALAVLARPSSWFTSTYPNGAIPTLRRLIAREPQARILADVRYADWLIWEDPRLFSGRVAYDTSFELLRTSQLEAIADLAANTANARGTVDGYQIWMLYPGNHAVNRVLLRRPGVGLIMRTRRVIIATHALPARS